MKTIQQIFHDHAAEYLAKYRGSSQERKALNAICNCRTPDAGQHVFVCPNCKHEHLTNSSCGNRHCPICQNDKAAEWVYRQQLKQLPCTYFLATFTLPHEFHRIARCNPDKVYRALFNASANSLKILESDKRFVGCDLVGFFGILHTWGRQMQYHPHIHYVVAGGGLSRDRDSWINPRQSNFLVHVRALSAVFKGKFKAELAKHNLLVSVPEHVWQKDWVVHCKSVGNGQRALTYMGAYVFRVAISNARIVDYDGNHVTFKYYKVGSRRARTCSLAVLEFIRRYMQHVLPKGFMKIRHYGFLSGKCSISIEHIRKMIPLVCDQLRKMLPVQPPEKINPLMCPHCKAVMKWSCFIIGFRRVANSP